MFTGSLNFSSTIWETEANWIVNLTRHKSDSIIWTNRNTPSTDLAVVYFTSHVSCWCKVKPQLFARGDWGCWGCGLWRVFGARILLWGFEYLFAVGFYFMPFN